MIKKFIYIFTAISGILAGVSFGGECKSSYNK